MPEEIINSSLTFNEYWMRFVYLTALKSKDPSTKIAAIITRENILVASGFNGFPRGVKDLKQRYEDKSVKYEYVAQVLAASRRAGLTKLGFVTEPN